MGLSCDFEGQECAAFGLIGVFCLLWLRPAAHLASSHRASHHCAPLHVQIDEREADLQPVEVLGDTAIANFAESEYAFENTERMLNMGAHTRLGAVLRHLLSAEARLPR